MPPGGGRNKAESNGPPENMPPSARTDSPGRLRSVDVVDLEIRQERRCTWRQRLRRELAQAMTLRQVDRGGATDAPRRDGWELPATGQQCTELSAQRGGIAVAPSA
jgi:hypothetical protein